MKAYEVIKDLCDKAQLPVTVLEKKLGFSRGSILKMKTATVANADRIKAIADYFGVSQDYIMTGKTEEYYLNPKTAAEAQEMFEDPEMRTLFHMKRNMSPEKFKPHYEMMKQLYRLEHPEDDFIDD